MVNFIKKLSAVLLACFCVISISACASAPPEGNAAYQYSEYRLAPGDKLKITVFGENAFNKEYVVSAAGDISVPLIGDVAVTGKSPSQLQSELQATLSDGYLNDPRVNVDVANYRAFYILGEVKNAGEFPYEDKLTAFQAVALAGGFTYRADQRQVYIRRVGVDSEQTYNLNSGKQVYIAPGDTLRIGERYF